MGTPAAMSLWLLGGYTAVLIVISLLRGAKNQSSDYMIGSRQVGVLATMASITGNLRDGAGLAAWVALGYAYGFGSLWLTAGLIVALITLARLAPRLRQWAEENDFVTINELLRKRIGPITARLAATVIAITAFLYAGAQIYVSGNIFAVLLDTPSLVGILLSAFVVGIYLLIGGYRTTILTGLFQWGILMLILVLPWFFHAGQIVPQLNSIFSPSWNIGLSFFGLSFLVVFSSSDIWQLIFSSQSTTAAKKALLWSVPVYILISIGLVLFSFAVRGVVGQDIDPSNALFSLFSSTAVSSILVAIVGVFIAAAVMSTLDSQLFLFTTTVTRELLPQSVRSTSQRMQWLSRIILLATVSALTIIASSIGDLVQFLFSAVTLVTILVPIFWLAAGSRQEWLHLDKAVGGIIVTTAAVYSMLFYIGAFSNLLMTLVPAFVASLLTGLMVLKYRNVQIPTRQGGSDSFH